ncbi:MAG TPA: HAD family phosphatase [Candidatus Elarobacter sp.]|nr:HAD family phosphatase [Candidatus Elarobacter sp.]
MIRRDELRCDAVVFDLDGTIVDTIGADLEACRLLYEEHDVELDAARWAATVCGSIGGYDVLFDELLGASRGATSRAQLRARLQQLWSRTLVDGAVDLLPGVRELLAHLAARGIPTAVATASARSWAVRWLEHFSLGGAFAAIVGSDDVARTKPFPDVYLRAAALLCAQPAACVAIEDSPTGVQAAKAAGMRIIAVPTVHTRHLGYGEADLVVEDLRSVPASFFSRPRAALP